ncbi:MAG: hypothetical protein ACOZQL_24400 [Myxococcota bacterium]
MRPTSGAGFTGVGGGDDPCALPVELARVRRAQALLVSSPRDALSVLDVWERDCARGTLVEERLALRALALCAQHERDLGRAILRDLRARFPTSPALERVDRACAAP